MEKFEIAEMFSVEELKDEEKAVILGGANSAKFKGAFGIHCNCTKSEPTDSTSVEK